MWIEGISLVACGSICLVKQALDDFVHLQQQAAIVCGGNPLPKENLQRHLELPAAIRTGKSNLLTLN
jgi:hypothetical protein